MGIASVPIKNMIVAENTPASPSINPGRKEMAKKGRSSRNFGDYLAELCHSH
jgi:hypothetical protein